MLSDVAEFVVQGITMEGTIFEPQDWAENLRDTLFEMDENKNLNCSSYVRPITSNGMKCLIVRSSLQTAHLHAFEHIKQYIADHHLVVRAGRGISTLFTCGQKLFNYFAITAPTTCAHHKVMVSNVLLDVFECREVGRLQ